MQAVIGHVRLDVNRYTSHGLVNNAWLLSEIPKHFLQLQGQPIDWDLAVLAKAFLPCCSCEIAFLEISFVIRRSGGIGTAKRMWMIWRQSGVRSFQLLWTPTMRTLWLSRYWFASGRSSRGRLTMKLNSIYPSLWVGVLDAHPADLSLSLAKVFHRFLIFLLNGSKLFLELLSLLKSCCLLGPGIFCLGLDCCMLEFARAFSRSWKLASLKTMAFSPLASEKPLEEMPPF